METGAIDAAAISEVQKKYPALTQFGFGGDGPIRTREVGLCVQWLLMHDGLDRRKTINEKISSYTLKHVIENAYETYIANGEVICAALYLKYKMRVRGPNAVFNIRELRPHHKI